MRYGVQILGIEIKDTKERLCNLNFVHLQKKILFLPYRHLPRSSYVHTKGDIELKFLEIKLKISSNVSVILNFYNYKKKISNISV